MASVCIAGQGGVVALNDTCPSARTSDSALLGGGDLAVIMSKPWLLGPSRHAMDEAGRFIFGLAS